MNGKRNMITTVLAGLLALFAPAGAADAAPTVKAAVQSVCQTGYRGMPEYDRKCLRTGTFRDGALLWLGNGAAERRAVCKVARTAGIRSAVRELTVDMAYDRYRNHNTVIGYATATAVLDCKSMGYKIK